MVVGMAACRMILGRPQDSWEFIVVSFEETYSRYPFSELVSLGVEASNLYRRILDRRMASAKQASIMKSADMPASPGRAA
jgi:hypothetical protein